MKTGDKHIEGKERKRKICGEGRKEFITCLNVFNKPAFCPELYFCPHLNSCVCQVYKDIHGGCREEISATNFVWSVTTGKREKIFSRFFVCANSRLG